MLRRRRQQATQNVEQTRIRTGAHIADLIRSEIRAIWLLLFPAWSLLVSLHWTWRARWWDRRGMFQVSSMSKVSWHWSWETMQPQCRLRDSLWKRHGPRQVHGRTGHVWPLAVRLCRCVCHEHQKRWKQLRLEGWALALCRECWRSEGFVLSGPRVHDGRGDDDDNGYDDDNHNYDDGKYNRNRLNRSKSKCPRQINRTRCQCPTKIGNHGHCRGTSRRRHTRPTGGGGRELHGLRGVCVWVQLYGWLCRASRTDRGGGGVKFNDLKWIINHQHDFYKQLDLDNGNNTTTSNNWCATANRIMLRWLCRSSFPLSHCAQVNIGITTLQHTHRITNGAPRCKVDKTTLNYNNPT